MHKRKKFVSKTIVINKHKILAYVICFIFGIIIFATINIASALFPNKLNISDNIYKYILNSGLSYVLNPDLSSDKFLSFFNFDEYSKKALAITLPLKYDSEHAVQESTAEDKTSDDAATQTSTQASDDVYATQPPQTEYPIESVSVSNAGKSIQVNNATNYAINPAEFLKRSLSFKNMASKKPTVLIVHTHTTESYTPNDKTTYSQADSDRSTDSSKNIVKVGEAFAAELEKNGIKVIHDKTVHDYPSYNGAYQRSLATISANLKKYPSIQVVIDVHRDGIIRSDGTKVGVSTQIDSQKTAQLMLVTGTDANGLSHGNWRDNAAFAFKLQETAIGMYPGLMRPVNIRKERFNQHLTKGSLILEVGSNGNTLDEAVLGVKYFANVMANVLKNY